MSFEFKVNIINWIKEISMFIFVCTKVKYLFVIMLSHLRENIQDNFKPLYLVTKPSLFFEKESKIVR